MPTLSPRRPSSCSRSASVLFVLLLGVLLAGSAHAEDWPQFRGPNGRAVSSSVRMPADFGPDSPELKWKVSVRGEGISSPIVSNGKVFVTSAYQGEERSKIRGRTTGAMVVLAVLALLGLVLGRFRRRADEDGTAPAPFLVRLLCGLDGLAVAVTALGFLALALIATLQPDRLYRAGLPGDAWLVTGTLGLAGLVAAFGGFPPRSFVRLLGVVVLLGAAFFVLQNLPLNKHREVFKPAYRAVLVAPAIGGAVWFLFLFLVVRGRPALRTARMAVLAGPALALMAGVLFVSTNFLSPQAGLVRALLCMDLETGAVLWDTPLFVAPEERLHRQNSFATPTPCTDGERVFAYFGPGYACVDFDGAVLWEGRDESYVENSRYGCVSSPIAYEDLFIINQENEQELRPSFVMALDRETGERRWRVEPEFAHDSYMTPSLVPVGDTIQLVTVSMAKVAAYDPRTGETLWTLDLPTWQHAPSLTYQDDLLFVSGGAHVKWVTAVLRLSGTGKDTKPEIVWQNKKGVSKSSSPILYDGVYVMGTNAGIMSCYVPETGELLWKERIDGSVLASLVGGDGKILVCTERGGVLVIEAGPEFALLSTADLGETIRATPAIADGRVLIRTDEHVFCFEGREPVPSDATGG